MPRTQGAKNKPKPDSTLINELQQRGYSVSKAGEKQANGVKSVVVKRSKLEIKKPVIPKLVESQENAPDLLKSDVYRCGNSACGKLLAGEVTPCPYCGAILKW